MGNTTSNKSKGENPIERANLVVDHNSLSKSKPVANTNNSLPNHKPFPYSDRNRSLNQKEKLSRSIPPQGVSTISNIGNGDGTFGNIRRQNDLPISTFRGSENIHLIIHG